MRKVTLADKNFFSLVHLITWSGMAFQAGAINSAGLIICLDFVSHVTGIGSRIGIAFAKGHYLTSLLLFLVPICFASGCAFSSIFIDCRVGKKKNPFVREVMGLISFLLLLINFFHLNNYFIFSNINDLVPSNLALMFVLSFICGLMNSSVASCTHGMIRVTHLTGATTDIGVNIPKLFLLRKIAPINHIKNLLIIRILIFLSFSSGSFISSYIVFHYNSFAFMLPMLTSFLFLFISIRTFDINTWHRY